jgi:hypothetical protein
MAACGALFARQAAPQYPTPAVAMEDQFEKHRDVADHRGDVVVLIYGDRQSAQANKALGERLHVHFHPSAKGQTPARARQAPVVPVPGAPAGARSPDVLAIPVACIGKVPGLVRALIRSRIRSGSPDVPVWLDFEDVMKGQFPMQAEVPNAVVLDVGGRLRYSAAGQPTAEGVGRLLGVIAGLRQEAVARR